MNNRVKRLILFAQAVAGDIKALKLKIGNTDTLVTDDKTSTVNAINEVAGSYKEIKDAMKKFSDGLGLNQEIVDAFNISIDPFEILLPNVKESLGANEQETPEEQLDRNNTTLIADNNHKVVYWYSPDNFNTVSQVNQGTFSKYFKNTSANTTFSLPEEIDVTKPFNIKQYNLYKKLRNKTNFIPFQEYIKKNIQLRKIAEMKIDDINSLYDLNNSSYPSPPMGGTDLNVAHLLIKVNTERQITDAEKNKIYGQYGNSIRRIRLFVNNDYSKYFNIQTNTWNSMSEITDFSGFADIIISKFRDINNISGIIKTINKQDENGNAIKIINDIVLTPDFSKAKVYGHTITLPADTKNIISTILNNIYTDNSSNYNNVYTDFNDMLNATNDSLLKICIINKNELNTQKLYEKMETPEAKNYLIISDDLKEQYNYVTDNAWVPVSETIKNIISDTYNRNIQYAINKIKTKKAEAKIIKALDKAEIDWTSIANININTKTTDWANINSLIGTKEIVQNETYENFVDNNNIDLSHTKVYSCNYNTKSINENYDNILTKIPNLKVINARFNDNHKNLLKELESHGVIALNCIFNNYPDTHKIIYVYSEGEWLQYTEGQLFEKVKDILDFGSNTIIAPPDNL